jgi:hypothetical protein
VSRQVAAVGDSIERSRDCATTETGGP